MLNCPHNVPFSPRLSSFAILSFLQGSTKVHLSNVYFVLRDVSALLDHSWGP